MAHDLQGSHGAREDYADGDEASDVTDSMEEEEAVKAKAGSVVTSVNTDVDTDVDHTDGELGAKVAAEAADGLCDDRVAPTGIVRAAAIGAEVWGRAIARAVVTVHRRYVERMGSLRLRMDFLQRRLRFLGPRSRVQPLERELALPENLISSEELMAIRQGRPSSTTGRSHRRGHGSRSRRHVV